MVDDRGLIFLHLPKTAGSTLRPIIDRHYAAEVICKLDVLPRDLEMFLGLPEQTRSKIRVLEGHLQFGLHEHLSVPVDYVTMLRDPVDRMISMYYWILGNQKHILNSVVKSMSLADFAGSGFEITANHQTRLISGLMQNFSADALSVAKNNLTSHITAFGLNEKFDESLILFKSLLGWKRVFYVRRNVTKNRPRRDEPPDSTIQVIKNHNALDIELYEFARNRFDEMISKRGQSFQDEVAGFRRLNKIYGKFTMGKNIVRRALPPPARAAIKKGLRAFRSS